MAFIGIIADSKYEMQIKRVLESKLNSQNKEHTIIVINDKSIENVKNIKFETESSLEVVNNKELNIITFGFNSKATIIASSVEENFIISVQRKIVDINKKTIEPQEIEIKIKEKRLANNSHNLMGVASILLIYGKSETFF